MTQRMLDELGPWLNQSKATDLLKRLEHADPDQCLPAEYELALAWGVSKVATLEIDKPIGTKMPDIYSPDLVSGGPIVADVAALSDDALSGESLMRRAANIINGVCNRIVKRANGHLYYEFGEESGYQPADRHSNGWSRYFRRRRVSAAFKMDYAFEGALKSWLSVVPPPTSLRWQTEHIDVIITWRSAVHPWGNTFSSMPSVVHDARDNPLYGRLKEKERQLRNAPNGVRRAIFLGDAGCKLLWDLAPITVGLHTITGRQIIETFLADTAAIEFVAVFSPRHTNEHSPFSLGNPRIWFTHLFTRSQMERGDFARLEAIHELLPSPYLDGYQARSWHQQDMFDPQGRGQYLNPIWTGGRGSMSVKISARGLQELLAGRLTQEEFERLVTGEQNLFEPRLAQGQTISRVRFEPKGTDEDDDYIIFEFSDDPAASALKPPSPLVQRD